MSSGLPPMTKVESSNVDSLGHRGTTLYVRFKSGGLYSYEGVPSEVYHAGLAAESVGSWFRNRVRGTYKHIAHD